MMRWLTETLLLRSVDEHDLPEIARMWAYPDTVSIEEARSALEYMERTHAQNRPGCLCHLTIAVCEQTDPAKIIGWCGLDGEIEPGEVVLFYMIDEEHRDRGYATQCARQLLEYAFGEMQLNRISGGCDAANIASFRVMQKAGMHFDGPGDDGNPRLHIDRISYKE